MGYFVKGQFFSQIKANLDTGRDVLQDRERGLISEICKGLPVEREKAFLFSGKTGQVEPSRSI